jgi:dolichyl-phosphate beta-glucosyltransferase
MGKVFNRLIRLFLMSNFIDTQCGFKLFRRGAARTLFSESKIDGFAFDAEILYCALQKNYKIIEVPVTWSNHPKTRVHLIGTSREMLRDLFRIKKLHKL